MGMVIAGVRCPERFLPPLPCVVAIVGPLGPQAVVMDPLKLAVRAKEGEPASESPVRQVPSAAQWAVQQFGQVDLGDRRLNQRAVEMAARMAAHPEASLPNQMGAHSALVGAYRLLNSEGVTMEALLSAHRQQTLAAAGRLPVVLMVEDTTELDYSGHPCKGGLGPVGNERGRGLLLHSTLAVAPEGRDVLGLAHAQVVARQEIAKPNQHRRHTQEGQVWEASAKAVGSPPEGALWVHVSDRESDIFDYMATCVDLGKHFLVRAYQNRVLVWDGELEPTEGEATRKLLDYARSLPPQAEGGYTVPVPARKGQPAREARVVLQWAPVKIKPGSHASPAMRHHAPVTGWLLRVWEPDPPAGVEPVEWILLSDLPITAVAEAHRAVGWYCCRWICEDYHMCLKTGCQVERSQLDDADDIRRLLGFAIPIAVRLLQLRQWARQSPELPAKAVVEPLMVDVLALRRNKGAQAMTIGEFWQSVAQMGGHQGRRGDGPPGWRTVWKGWRYLSDLTEGARLVARGNSISNERSV
jgi:hypothetical protein